MHQVKCVQNQAKHSSKIVWGSVILWIWVVGYDCQSNALVIHGSVWAPTADSSVWINADVVFWILDHALPFGRNTSKMIVFRWRYRRDDVLSFRADRILYGWQRNCRCQFLPFVPMICPFCGQLSTNGTRHICPMSAKHYDGESLSDYLT